VTIRAVCYASRVIDSIKIENFRCIRSAEIKLAPLTVFVGPNGSGKSTIVDALDAEHSRGGLSTWRRQAGQFRFEVVSSGSRQKWGPGHGPYSAQILHLQPSLLRQENVVQRAERLTMDGSNLANVFATLTRRDQEALSKSLCTLVPVIGDVDVLPTESGGRHQLRFQDRWDPSVWYSPNEVSDGTMLVTAFLTLQYQPTPVDLLAIEDAEHALHPYLLSELVKLLRKLATGQLGPRTIQVVATTHSAELLDYLAPEEVRFVSRDPNDGGVVVEAINTTRPDWQGAFEEYKQSLADVWLSGGAGGV
jgi:predicted ATPase